MAGFIASPSLQSLSWWRRDHELPGRRAQGRANLENETSATGAWVYGIYIGAVDASLIHVDDMLREENNC